MNKFSVPADFDLSTIDFYSQLNSESSRVIETYGSLTQGNIFESGRPKSVLPEVGMKEFEKYVDYSRKNNINFNYTLNATSYSNKEFEEEYVEEMIHFLRRLHDAGVTSLTIAMPSLIELVKSAFDCFEIKASTLCQITNVNKALKYKKLGVNRIVLDESINRKFNNIKKIKEHFGPNVELIANVICHQDCIYRMFHYNQMSSISLTEGNPISESYYPQRCLLQRYQNVGNLLKLCWIRPEDLKYYNDIGITNFKLQGRQAIKTKGHKKTVEYYFDQKYDGDLIDLLNMFDPLNSFRINMNNKDLDGFIEPFTRRGRDFCQNNCSECGYCDKYANKIINTTHAHDVIQKTKKFYSEYDPFLNQVKTVASKMEGEKVISNITNTDKTELDEFNF
ncbi:MAG: U32 family peptidase [Marinifilaceae bacterium]